MFKIDRFMIAILGAVVVASIFPVRGWGVELASWATTIAVALVFFGYGVRLKRDEALSGLTNWRFHLIILALTFGVFPAIGVALSLVTGSFLAPELVRGLLYVCLLPSTVQSSVTFTSIARGNVAGAIVAASASNLVGVFATPALVLALMSSTGAPPSWGQVANVVGLLLVPFVLGQLARNWVGSWAATKSWFDKIVIVAVVYTAFSQGMREGTWSKLRLLDGVVLVGLCVLLVALMLWFTGRLARSLKFSRADSIAIQFCATKKSLATGAPMAAILFAGTQIGTLVLPLMVFHQVQLLACAMLARRYSLRGDD